MTTNITPGNTPKLKCEITLYGDGHYQIQTTRNGSYLPLKSARVQKNQSDVWGYERWEHGDHLPKSLGKLNAHVDNECPDWRTIINDMFSLSPVAEAIPEVVYPYVVPSGAGFDWQMEQDYRWVRQFKTREEAEEVLWVYKEGLKEWEANMGVYLDYWPLEPGVFSLEDINQGWRRFRQSNRYGQPKAMILGKFEIDQLSDIVVGNTDLIPERSADCQFKPFEIFGMTTYPVDEPTSFRVLG